MATLIQWATEVWNPTSGCTKISTGCLGCYIETTIPFRTQHRRFDKAGIGGTTDVQLHPGRLSKPFGWAAGQRVFVDSVSDLFHRQVPDDYVARVFAVMGLADHHTFLLLSKRHSRLRSLLTSAAFVRAWQKARGELVALPKVRRLAERGVITLEETWPIPNLHLGVSVEDQSAAELRVEHLLAAPAEVRWLSCEPLVGPVDLTRYLPSLDWLVIGGESGKWPRRRMDPRWALELCDQAREHQVPVFFKQAGAVLAQEWGCADPKGGEPDEWPQPWPREFPAAA
jgi:protein gp37